MSQHTLGTWIFGKYPTHGDFVTLGTPHHPKEALDRWLTLGMHEANLAFGDQFRQRFDAAPAWNFVDQGRNGYCYGGILCASMDKANRPFPLIMATRASDFADAAHASAGCHSLLARAFAENWTPQMLASSEVIPEAISWVPTESEWALLSEDGPFLVVQGQWPSGIITAALEVAL